ncbi:MAG: glycoside hydrolase family 97 N-terminal domain-containing protein, partial [Muribaculaceae bacterium]|nr:glycoside hydrolase family 97 N-terminal domain-containing protein [Muribaculaceae bacterium]
MRTRDIIKFFAIQATLILPGLYAGAAERVSSPDGNLCLTAEVKTGKAQYSLKRGDRTVLNPSRLGFI